MGKRGPRSFARIKTKDHPGVTGARKGRGGGSGAGGGEPLAEKHCLDTELKYKRRGCIYIKPGGLKSEDFKKKKKKG